MSVVKNNKKRFVCGCNCVTLETIEKAIERGCTTLPKIYNTTTAGIGQCGGTCRPEIQKILDDHKSQSKKPKTP
jgi:bacterioferritin-associated ferredoxin